MSNEINAKKLNEINTKELDEDVFAFVKKNPNCKCAEIAAALNLDTKTIRASLKRCMVTPHRGQLVFSAGKTRGTTYSVAAGAVATAA